MTSLTIRPATPSDVELIKQLAVDNRMFEPDELGHFDDMLTGFFDGTLDGHQWLVAEPDDAPGSIAAAAYVAPEPFSDRMWNLYFLATDPRRHGSGAGTAIVEHIVLGLRGSGESVARTLIVDTSSLGDYEQARAFYRARGFVEEATIRDFYGPGDHKVTFWMLLVD